MAMAKNLGTKKVTNAVPELYKSFLIYEVPDSNIDEKDKLSQTRIYNMSEILLDIVTEKNYYKEGENCILTEVGIQNNVTILVDIVDVRKCSTLAYLSKQDLRDYFETFGHVGYISIPALVTCSENGDYCWLIQFSDSQVVESLEGTEHIIKGVRVKFTTRAVPPCGMWHTGKNVYLILNNTMKLYT